MREIECMLQELVKREREREGNGERSIDEPRNQGPKKNR